MNSKTSPNNSDHSISLKDITCKVSIVIPVYNADQYLAQCVESLLGQNYENLEIIAVNDGSTDNSHDILEQYGSRLKVIYQENQGQAAALNRGWEIAQGEILGYLSADDLLLPEAISKLTKVLIQNPSLSAVYPDYNLIDQEGKKIKRVKAPEFSHYDLAVRGICQPGPGALFWRKAWKQTKGWDLSLKQMPDYDFWLKMSLKGNLLRHPQVLAEFRVHQNSQSFAVSSFSKSNEPLLVFKNFFSQRQEIPDNILKNESTALAFSHLLSTRLHLRSGRPGEAWKHLLQSVSASPRALLSYLGLKRLMSGLYGWLYLRIIS